MTGQLPKFNPSTIMLAKNETFISRVCHGYKSKITALINERLCKQSFEYPITLLKSIIMLSFPNAPSVKPLPLTEPVILDLYPWQTREMNVLLDVYESGVPREIRSAGTITDSQYAAYVQRIVNDYGLQEKYVIEGLDAWIDQCICVGTAAKIHKPEILPIDGINGNSHPQPIKHAPIGAQSVQNVAGSSFDFDLKAIDANSVEIIKFKGFHHRYNSEDACRVDSIDEEITGIVKFQPILVSK